MKFLKNLGQQLSKTEQKEISGGITWGWEVDQTQCELNGGTWNDFTCCFPPRLAGFYDGSQC